MSKFFNDENQPIVTKLTIKCPKCGEKNDVWLGFAIVGKNETNSQPKQRTWVCKNCNSDITISITDKK